MRYRMIGAVCFVLGAAALAVAADDPPARPNILWLIAEDLGPELSCYGHPQVWTPNIDSLATDGVRFTHAYTTCPVCSTSRSSFMTGMYSQTIGTHNHRSHRDDGYRLPDGVRVITDWLSDAGYYTANIRRFPAGVDFRGTGKTDWNFQYDGRPFDSDRWSDLADHQPFYAQVNFPETHRGPSWDNADTQIERVADPAKVVFPPYYPDHEITRRDWAQYLNAAMSLDRKIGVILGLLSDAGLADNTIVVFLGDHGRAMVRGKQWPYDSGLHIPLIIHWPAAVPAPSQYESGGVNEQLIASIDLSATTLSWAGVAKPQAMQGRVFWGEDADPPREYVYGGRDRGDETVDRIRTVRDARFRYIRNYYAERPFTQLNRYKEFSYPVLRLMHRLHDAGKLADLNPDAERLMAPTRPREELYDLEEDPYEIRNLADDRESHDTLVRLRGELESWVERIDDQGRFPESPEVIESWELQMRKNYDERLEQFRRSEAE
jgi:N-sulfoglucosamine sulfohydrolase